MIIFNKVSKRFGDTSALENIDFSVNPGELVMITGHSGSGKTTLMRLLTKEYSPSAGDIIFDDTPLSKIGQGKVHHHRRKIGVVFQDYKLLPELNVWENIALALSIIGTHEAEIENRVTDLLDLVKLTDKAFLFPSQLSGGEAQRVSIARALSTAPKIVFADEPTGNLDQETSHSIIELLQKINQLGTTVMITTHNQGVRDILKAARHLELEQGRLKVDSAAKKSEPKKEADAKSAQLEKEEVKSDSKSTPDDDKKSDQAGSSFWSFSWLPGRKKPKEAKQKVEGEKKKNKTKEKNQDSSQKGESSDHANIHVDIEDL